MAVTASYGYDGTVNEPQWAAIAPFLGLRYAVGSPSDWAVSVKPGVDRTVTVAGGSGGGYGVVDVSTATDVGPLPVVSSGVRWDTIVCRRDWQPVGGSTSFTFAQGGQLQRVASGLNANPGVLADQPLALVQVTAGQQVPTAVVDLRRGIAESAWFAYTPASPVVSVGSGGVLGGRYRIIGSTLDLCIHLDPGPGWNGGTSDLWFGLPPGVTASAALGSQALLVLGYWGFTGTGPGPRVVSGAASILAGANAIYPYVPWLLDSSNSNMTAMNPSTPTPQGITYDSAGGVFNMTIQGTIEIA